ncbi:hypothetical protein BCR33DRAFT_711043 [Rhizoclosmatium globosum]|uniref:Uncharacterized protein n=1 Tax=Rhizoclosmatium globosum TaxID=329046 RepID=A0A1Y2D347_9FUNG|nr:hypothetical protein BCR33DRAFT_711043 [Rhizoclosmatium globosum]|eukprot:ORY53680.1 hypothetical protein BCR33DRAFT_711043 [Rhizoclosmatium globosum]
MSLQQSPSRLYRQFLRIQQQWPAQEDRANRLSVHIKSSARSQIEEGPADLEYAQKELAALKDLVEGNVLKKYPLSPNSQILAVLPPRSAYQLLDQSAQAALSKEKVSTLTFFPTYVWGSLKRMMR